MAPTSPHLAGSPKRRRTIMKREQEQHQQQQQLDQMRKRVLEKKLKQKIAKSLILHEFTQLYPEPVVTPPPSAPRPENAYADRIKRAASLVADRSLVAVYDIEGEFGKKLEISLQYAIKRLAKTCDMSRRRADEQFLLEQCMSQLQAMLRGCDVYYGLLKPGGNNLIYSEVCSRVSGAAVCRALCGH